MGAETLVRMATANVADVCGDRLQLFLTVAPLVVNSRFAVTLELELGENDISGETRGRLLVSR